MFIDWHCLGVLYILIAGFCVKNDWQFLEFKS